MVLRKIILILLLTGLFFVGWWLGRRSVDVRIIEHTRIDTAYFERPQPHKILSSAISVEVPKWLFAPADTTFTTVTINPNRDSVPVQLPFERREYRDSSYFAIVSGIALGDCHPTLEHIETYGRTITQQKIIRTPYRWQLGPAAGVYYVNRTGDFDCYRLTGEKLWRIDMGKNIRAGAHYTQFMVYDLDGDGKAEIVMKTSDGTIDGKGKVIGDATADYREPGDPNQPKGGDFSPNDPRSKGKPTDPLRNQGRILTGNEYLTVFNGLTGEAMQTIDYIPLRGDLKGWGDERANRSDRFLACVAYLDGVHPSVVMCRGYYTRTVLAAFDWNGKELKNRWVFDSNNPGCEKYAGQGNHNLRVGDIDQDGCDEIVYGSCTFDHDGKGLYSTGMGHGDAMHLTQFDPASASLQVWACHENRKDGSSFRDAKTGKVLLQYPDKTDVGRCMAAEIDPTSPGVEMWSLASGGIRNIKGEVVAEKVPGLSYNMAVWWDGDLLRELLDKGKVSKYDWKNKRCDTIFTLEGCAFNNGTKSNPSLQGDLIGDWREEVLVRTDDNKSLRLYVTTIPTEYRFHTFLEDPVYRISIATQNVAYNQPTQPGFYIGPELKGTFRGYTFK